MRRDAQMNHQKILATARKLFATQETSHVSMKQLASAAQIGIGTLYRNFPNKGSLCLALAYDSIHAFVVDQNAYLDTTTDKPNGQLAHVLQGYLAVRAANEGLLTSIETESSPEQLTQLLQNPLYVERVTLLLRVLHRVQPASEPAYLQFQADMVVAMLKSRVYTFERYQRHLTANQLLKYTLRLLHQTS